jgi:hypothetical protein
MATVRTASAGAEIEAKMLEVRVVSSPAIAAVAAARRNTNGTTCFFAAVEFE